MEYWDTAGKRYFDGIGGIFTSSLGHQHPPIVEALKKQLDKMTFAPPMHSISSVTLDFVEKLGEVTPGDLNFIKSYCSASEAMESAIKWTRSYHKLAGSPGKYKFVSRYDSWHGATAAAVAASGGASRKSPHEPHMPGFLKLQTPLFMRDKMDWSWEECNRFCAQQFEDTIVAEDPSTIAGVILEPISNTAGIMTPTQEYMEMIREICTKYNVTLIFDETITGFCKTGSMFAAQTYGVTPDIIVCGKGLSNGTMPLSAMITTSKMAEVFQQDEGSMFAHGQTFAGQPLGAAVGLAVLKELTERDLATKAAENGVVLRKHLADINEELGCFREVRGQGILLGVELMEDSSAPRATPAWGELGAALKTTSLENGLILRADGAGWFSMAPALCATEDDLSELASLLRKSLLDARDKVTRARA
jgi:adenosylmethionine-8-amino-7-oxononanoate aminotransferase